MRSSDDREFSRRGYVEPDLPRSGVLYELMNVSGEPSPVEEVMRSPDDHEFSRRGYVGPSLPQSGLLHELITISGEPSPVEYVRLVDDLPIRYVPTRQSTLPLAPQTMKRLLSRSATANGIGSMEPTLRVVGRQPESGMPSWNWAMPADGTEPRPSNAPVAPGEESTIKPSVPSWVEDVLSEALGWGEAIDAHRSSRIRRDAARPLNRGPNGAKAVNRAMAKELIGPRGYSRFATLDDLQKAANQGKLPLKKGSRSHNIINDGLQRSKGIATIGRIGRVGGPALGPAIGAFDGYLSIDHGDSVGTKIAKTILGGVKDLDDTGLSVLAGIGGGLVAAPSAPMTAGLAPVVAGAVASDVASELYDESFADKLIDGGVDYLTPKVAAGIDGVVDFVERGYRALPSFSNRYRGPDGVAPGW